MVQVPTLTENFTPVQASVATSAKVLEWLVAFGASHEILVEAHPHIGTNKLPGIITAIRQFILDHGGEVHFGKGSLPFRQGMER